MGDLGEWSASARFVIIDEFSVETANRFVAQDVVNGGVNLEYKCGE